MLRRRTLFLWWAGTLAVLLGVACMASREAARTEQQERAVTDAVPPSDLSVAIAETARQQNANHERAMELIERQVWTINTCAAALERATAELDRRAARIRQCQRWTRPAASDAWVEGSAGQWRTCEEIRDRNETLLKAGALDFSHNTTPNSTTRP